MKEIVISRKVYFGSGALNNDGSTYLEAYVQGQLSPKTGLIINLSDLDLILKEFVSDANQKLEPPDLAEASFHFLKKKLVLLNEKIKIVKVLVRQAPDKLGVYTCS